MKKKTVKWAVFLAILLALVLFCKWYTRPLPFRYFFPYAEQVVELGAYWDVSGQAQIPPDDPRFEPLMELLESTQYRRSLRNLFLKDRFQNAEENDSFWQVKFLIEQPIPVSAGGRIRGFVFELENWFGHLRFRDLLSGDETIFVYMDDQQAFCDAVEQILKDEKASSQGEGN